MRTTIEIDDDLLKAAQKAAAERGVPLRRVVEESLALALKQHAGGRRLHWKVTKGPVRPGVDLADRDRLYESMKGRD